MSTLVREPAQIVEEPETDEFDAKFAEEVSKELCYHILADTTYAIRNERTKNLTILKEDAILVKALRRLDIMPFTQKSVARYKKKVAWKATRIRERIVLILGFVGLGLLATALLSFIVGLSLFWTIGSTIMLKVGTVTIIGALLCGVTFGISMENMTRWEAVWNEHSLEYYTGQVPEFALQSALDLKRECSFSDVKLYFEIDEMTMQRKPRLDPFLIVYVSGGPKHYIEVWNEPKYKQERVV